MPALTPGKIQELLQDPNSWLSKLYKECEIEVALQHKEQMYAHYLMMEEAYSTKVELENTQSHTIPLADLLANISAPVIGQRQQVQPIIPPLYADNWKKLTAEMGNLLVTTLENMSVRQLEAHQQAVVNNFNTQVAIALGDTITLSGATLRVPKTPRPAITTGQVLSVNPALATVVADEKLRESFARFQSLMQLGAINVLATIAFICEENGVEFTALLRDDRRILLRAVETALVMTLENNPTTLMNHFVNLNSLTLSKMHTADYQTQYSPSPGASAAKAEAPKATPAAEETPTFKPSRNNKWGN